jgi:MoaA/NifB/PqqE/SkfB family radical SAM enzyme
MNTIRLRTYLTPEEKADGRLRELWLEVGPSCHLRCGFCFNSAGGSAAELIQKQMPLTGYNAVLEQFANLGGKVVGIPGFGEPFSAPNLTLTKHIIEESARLGIRTHIYTAGDLLTGPLVHWLRSKPVTLGIKFNHFESAVQDSIVQQEGYTDRRKNALNILLQYGFFGDSSAEFTRMSFVTPVLPENAKVLPDIWRYCRDHGIIPDVDTLLPAGRASNEVNTDYDELAANVFRKLRNIDDLEYGIPWEVTSPTYAGGEGCNRCCYHLYVDFQGHVSPYLGANKKEQFLGNVSTYPLKYFWNSFVMRAIRNRHYSGRCTECIYFKTKACSSCLGRCANLTSTGQVETKGCWNFA